MTTATEWAPKKTSRTERYLTGLSAIRAVDLIKGGEETMPERDLVGNWLVSTWGDPRFTGWFLEDPYPEMSLSISWRTRRGWSIRPVYDGAGRQGGVAVEIGGAESMIDVELATIVGCAGRMAGLMHQRVNRPTYDSGTVTVAAAALLIHRPGRAKELWDLMAAIKMPGAPPPLNAEKWTPEIWGAKE